MWGGEWGRVDFEPASGVCDEMGSHGRHAMMRSWRARFLGALLAVSAGALLAGCDDQLDYSSASGRASAPIPAKTLAKMEQIGTTASAPVLIRAYKQEAEFEMWKQKADGHYALLKTYPDVPLVWSAWTQEDRGRPSGAGGFLYDHPAADEPEFALVSVVQRRLSQRL